MFQKRTGHLVAIAMLLNVSAQPLISCAEEPDPSTVQRVSESVLGVQGNNLSALKDVSFSDLRQETKIKISESRQWVEAQKFEVDYKTPLQSLDMKINKFQDSVEPAGRSLKASLKSKFSGMNAFRLGTRTVSASGILLVMAFGIAFFLLNASGPSSRLGGRH